MGNLVAILFLASSAIMFTAVVVMGIIHWSEERKTVKAVKPV